MNNLPQRGRMPHDVPSWVPEGSFFFISINCQPRRRNHLARAGIGDAVLAAAAFNHTRCTWYCRILLLMPDHLHAILAFGQEPGMKTVIKNWKRYLAAKQGISWQRDFCDHRLRTAQEEAEKLEYILMNPVRWNLVKRAEDWPWIYRPKDRQPPRLGY